jgi:hypothetical protein
MPLEQRLVPILRTVVTIQVVLIVPLFALLVIRGPVDGQGDEGQGYWGAKTATVNWCEADYTVTTYVAEFANALSSLTVSGPTGAGQFRFHLHLARHVQIPLNGLYGLYRHWGTVETKFLCAFAIFIVVGLGSAAFHSTLWRSMQLMDELPMVWGNSIFIFVLITMEDDKRPRQWEALAIAIITMVLSASIIFMDAEAAKDGTEGSGQDVFLVTYGSG